MNFEPVANEPDVYRVEGVVDIRNVTDLQCWLLQHPDSRLDLSAALEFDTAAALVLWQHWDRQLPADVVVTDKQHLLFDRIGQISAAALDAPRPKSRDYSSFLMHNSLKVCRGLMVLFGRLLLDFLPLIRNPLLIPFKEFSAACYRSGVSALPITAIVGFLIGIVLSYLSSLSLQDYGAESLLPMVMGIGILRELGPLLTSIVLAGRSGSAVTAGLGAMRLTQELDALSALGIQHSRRLIFPRVAALAVMTPLLTVCTNTAALAGGLLSGWVELDLSPTAFLYGLRIDVPLSDMWIGLFKSTVFGAAIGIIACYFGMSAKANTESLATNTTRSVVLSISMIVLLDAMFAVLFKDI